MLSTGRRSKKIQRSTSNRVKMSKKIKENQYKLSYFRSTKKFRQMQFMEAGSPALINPENITTMRQRFIQIYGAVLSRLMSISYSKNILQLL